MAKKKLNPKQQRFVEEYLIDLNATQAAIRAGYSEKTADQYGYQLLQNSIVVETIEAAKAKRSASVGVTQEYILEMLTLNVNRALQAEPARDKDGQIVGDYKYEGAVANKALELLGKHAGMFNDKVKLEGNVNLVIERAVPRADDED